MATTTQRAHEKELETKKRSSTSRQFEEALREKTVGQDEAVEALVDLSRIAPCVRRALSEVDSVFFRRDLEIAKNVQEASFPQRPPAIPGLDCSTFYKPAHSVGGDYYDFLSLKDGAWGIAIGDVSGKGIGAALRQISVTRAILVGFQSARSLMTAVVRD